MSGDLDIIHIEVLCPVSNDGVRRGAAHGHLEMISDGAVAIRDGMIVAVGTTDEVLAAAPTDGDVATIDATGKTVLPGLVEAHSAYPCHRPKNQRLRLRG